MIEDTPALASMERATMVPGGIARKTEKSRAALVLSG
jgi:hypothetical protein